MKIKNILQGLSLTFIALFGGFIAIGVPFKLFTSFSEQGLKTFFFIEIALYIFIGGIFLFVYEYKKEEKAKQERRLIERQAKIDDVIENWYNLAA